MINIAYQSPIAFIFLAISMLISLSVHEFAHAWMAVRQGDPTPKLMGRLSLNPFVHMDLMGTLMILFLGFGYGKPVPINPLNFKEYKKGVAKVSFAGPASNLIVATIIGLLFRFSLIPLQTQAQVLLSIFLFVNLGLAFFNLLPFYPLDGFNLFTNILPYKAAQFLTQFKQQGPIILLFFVFFGITRWIISPLISLFSSLVIGQPIL